MKEIDFLPEWYKTRRRRQIGYHTQYVALVIIFVAVILWNLIDIHLVSKATAELEDLKSKVASIEGVSQEFTRIKGEIAELQGKADILKEIDSKIDIANVLAEISFLSNKKIVFGKIEFIAEVFADGQEKKTPGGSAIKAAQAKFAKKSTLSLGDVRFKVIINGVAPDASDVATLICNLEDSQYFCQVYPSFSRNKEMKATTKGVKQGTSYQVSEFEIGCYLANYRQEEAGFAKNVQSRKR